MSIADLIRRRLAELQKGPTELRAELLRVGHDVSKQAIAAWIRPVDPVNPSQDSLVALFTVLRVTIAERREWAEACGYKRLLKALDEQAAPLAEAS